MENSVPAILATSRGRIQAVSPSGVAVKLTDGTVLRGPAALLRRGAPGDEIEFTDDALVRPDSELRLCTARRVAAREIYQTRIQFVGQPKCDARDESFLAAEVSVSKFNIRTIYLPATAVRDNFFRGDKTRLWEDSSSLYEVLGAEPNASPAELRLAFKLKQLELQAAARQAQAELKTLERAFNLLMHPDLRATYDSMLTDPTRPAVFPFSGAGTIVVGGRTGEKGGTFFAREILSFCPDLDKRRIRVPFRRLDFRRGDATLNDGIRKIRAIIDPVQLNLSWDPTWNQWKHLVPAKIEIESTFVATGRYNCRSGEWRLIRWWTALPSRTSVGLPANLQEQITAARTKHHRFGQYSAEIEAIRARIQKEPIEYQVLRRLCDDMDVPADFDVSLVSWKADYDRFYYDELRRRARRIYLFKDEYIFELEHAIVVEVPQAGHATYVFSTTDPESFVRRYTQTTKADIRRNRNGSAEQLAFIGRLTHGSAHRTWVRELLSRIGERNQSAINAISPEHACEDASGAEPSTSASRSALPQ